MGKIVAFIVVIGAAIAVYSGWIYTTRMQMPAAPVAATAPAASQSILRIVEAENATLSCAPGETLISAICYSVPGSSPSASGPSFRETEPGVISATCFTGGRKIRLVCMAARP